MQLLQTALPWIQVVLAIVLTGLIMLQQGEGSLGAAFGGDSTAGGFRTKRGAEKVIFNITLVVSILFVVAAIVTLLIK
ncbi:MAG: preprotein translocase subunit SecG [Candidatus Paceibacterota bacterium]|jgi:preprotein translocase subunit SecG